MIHEVKIQIFKFTFVIFGVPNYHVYVTGVSQAMGLISERPITHSWVTCGRQCR